MRTPTILKTPELVFVAVDPPVSPPAEFGSVTSILDATVLRRSRPALANTPVAPSILIGSPVGMPAAPPPPPALGHMMVPPGVPSVQLMLSSFDAAAGCEVMGPGYQILNGVAVSGE